MTAEAPAHWLKPGGSVVTGDTCEPDCPACAAGRAKFDVEETERRRVPNVVRRDIVLGMWLEAIADGERSVEGALREIQAPLALLRDDERGRVLLEFTERALAISPRPLPAGRRVPKGPPTAWVRANRDLVDHVHRMVPHLPKTNPYESNDKPTLWDRVAEIWREYGIEKASYDIKANYYGKRVVPEQYAGPR